MYGAARTLNPAGSPRSAHAGQESTGCVAVTQLKTHQQHFRLTGGVIAGVPAPCHIITHPHNTRLSIASHRPRCCSLMKSLQRAVGYSGVMTNVVKVPLSRTLIQRNGTLLAPTRICVYMLVITKLVMISFVLFLNQDKGIGCPGVRTRGKVSTRVRGACCDTIIMFY